MVDDITEGVQNMNAPGNRKEREAAEAAAAKEKYMKLQAEGKTDQAKADLARLKLIREQRAADAARKQAERKRKKSKKRLERQKLRPKKPRSGRLPLVPKGQQEEMKFSLSQWFIL
ncbi:hypothetical protein J3459_008162 [Metarhizium acridum]|nr:hypothetical protein J3459_008162 [Metarhizium acridum]